MLAYTPAPGDAYASIERLEAEVPFGAFVRSVHHWSANLLVLVAGLHLLRVFFTGGFLDKRALNWVVGLVLLAAIAASSFTGYLLPWDQLAYWAVTIVTGMAGYVPVAGSALAALLRGGPEIGPRTLVTYYALHTQWLPVLLFAGAGFHFWRVRRAGGVVVPPDAVRDEQGKPEQVLFLPHLLWRETAAALVLVAARDAVRGARAGAARPGRQPGAVAQPGEGAVVLPRLPGAARPPPPAVRRARRCRRSARSRSSRCRTSRSRRTSRAGRGSSRRRAGGRHASRRSRAPWRPPCSWSSTTSSSGAPGRSTGGAALLTRGLLPAAGLVAVCVAGFRRAALAARRHAARGGAGGLRLPRRRASRCSRRRGSGSGGRA